MGLLDRLLGRDESDERAAPPPRPRAPVDPDEAAVERYRYLLRTAPPDTLEAAHAEAFAKLTPEQRRQVLGELANAVPPAERAGGDDPRSLARMATRAELREPGTMERALGGRGAGNGAGMGGMLAGTLLASVAGSFIGTSIAAAFLDGGADDAYAEGDQDGADADTGDTGAGGMDGADSGGGDGDVGGDVGGGLGGDFGGGDFGGDLGF